MSRYVLPCSYTIYLTIFLRCHYPAARRDGSMTGRDNGVEFLATSSGAIARFLALPHTDNHYRDAADSSIVIERSYVIKWRPRVAGYMFCHEPP